MASKIKLPNSNKINGNNSGSKGALSLNLILILITLLPLTIAILFISINSIYQLQSNLEKGSQNQLYIASSNLSNHCNEKQISFATADQFNDYIDSLGEKGIEMSILITGSPSVSSIKNENGYRVRDIEADSSVLDNPALMTDGVYKNDLVINGIDYYGYFTPIIVNDKLIGVALASQTKDEIRGKINKVVMTVVISSLITFIFFICLVTYITRKITYTVKHINNNVDVLSKGRLSLPSTRLISRIHEMNSLLAATNSLSSSLNDTIGNVKQVSENLITNVGDVTSLSESSAEKAEQIAYAMRELAMATNQVSEHVSDISIQMSDMGESINDISNGVESISQRSAIIIECNENAQISLNKIHETNDRTVEAVKDITDQINETNESIISIDEVVDLILEISSQTKLLSLNASIEAARAGEAGRGFAVVADEIRKLSEQSASGAEKIRVLAQTIIEKSSKSVDLSNEVYSLIEQERDIVSKTDDQYRTLTENIKLSADSIDAISQKTLALSNAKEKVIENVEGLSAISQETAASNEEVTSNIEEINDDVHTISNNCITLNNMADELNSAITFFNI